MSKAFPQRTGRFARPVRTSLAAFGMAAAALAFTPHAAAAQISPWAVQSALQDERAPADIRAFYAARGFRPLWIRGGMIGPEADQLIRLIREAQLDGLDPDDFRPRALARAVRNADEGDAEDLAEAEMQLSRSFAALVQDMRRTRDLGIVYADPELQPEIPSAAEALEAAAASPSLQTYLSNLGWMHPIYVQLRRSRGGLLAGGWGMEEQDRLLRINLERARALPADRGQRYVIVDAAAARLWMYEGGRVRDTMKVVVGKPDEKTPMMAGMIRYAILNPYWNVPPDLVQKRVAPGVLGEGNAFLRAKRYQVLSDWSDQARVVDPDLVDWQAVAGGRKEVRVRQLPGADNSMGKVKFMFPNDLGIYLHDTPEKALFRASDRRFSSGCVRVEDAARFGRWLYGKPLVASSTTPEQRVPLKKPVPVYITYLTAAPEGQTIAFRHDVYGRDALHLAALRGRSMASR